MKEKISVFIYLFSILVVVLKEIISDLNTKTVETTLILVGQYETWKSSG